MQGRKNSGPIARGKFINLLLGLWKWNLVVQWESKISLSNLVSDDFQ